jgi:hypothetical protein
MVSSIGEGKDTAPFLAEHGFQREPDDWKCFEPLVQPGPHFYLRFAGGVYKMSGPSLGVKELVVNSANEKIYGIVSFPWVYEFLLNFLLR